MMLGKKRIRINALHPTDREEYEEIMKAIKLGKKFIPIKTNVTYLEGSDKKLFISLVLELEW